ncbi:hypothetical protein FOA52_012990 [Chlamydomonas sp. UWO 241]|nr:hypothetical protein FOA52_012990 [Chlamydomonas sp. UWO 241]
MLPVRPPEPLLQATPRPPQQAASTAEVMTALQAQMAALQASNQQHAALAAEAMVAVQAQMTELQAVLGGGLASQQQQQQQQQQAVGALSAAAATAAVAAAAAAEEQLLHGGDESLCVLCMDPSRSATLLLCSHRVLCAACCANMRAANGQCPMCRATIQGAYTERSGVHHRYQRYQQAAGSSTPSAQPPLVGRSLAPRADQSWHHATQAAADNYL